MAYKCIIQQFSGKFVFSQVKFNAYYNIIEHKVSYYSE